MAGVVLGRQGAETGELLAVFDGLRVEHEAMDAKEFNDDGTYKTGIDHVRRVQVVCRVSDASLAERGRPPHGICM